MGPFGVLSFIKITLVSPSLDQKEQNCFGHPQFYSSIAPMPVLTNSDKNQPKKYNLKSWRFEGSILV